MVTFDDFKKLDIRIGKILSAIRVEGTEKLLKLEVDFGGDPLINSGVGKLQIISGIAQYYAQDSLVGKEFPFVINLEPKTFKGIQSQGMILAAVVNGQPVLISPDKEIPEGSVVK